MRKEFGASFLLSDNVSTGGPSLILCWRQLCPQINTSRFLEVGWLRKTGVR